MAFCDLNGNMDLAEEFVKYLIADARKDCPDEMELFAKFVDKELLARLDFVVERPFQRITYSDAVDLLRKSGEIVGGSQREERLEMLEENMRRHKMDPADYKWYLDLRRYGTAPHSGFGLGFERMLMFITGVPNIRDVIPFARTPGSAEF